MTSRLLCPGPAATGRAARERRGVASVLAMLYLVIFSTLALGFYTAVTTSAQVAHNERRATEARLAAESGLQFIRYEISRVKIPPLTPPDKRFGQLYLQLSKNLATSPNLDGRGVSYLPGLIAIPTGGTGYVRLQPAGSEFRVVITEVGGGETGGNLQVTLVGRSGGVQITRAIQMEFQPHPANLRLFDYGVAAYGKAKLGGDFDLDGDEQAIDGSLYSGSVDEFKTPVEIKKKASITGDVFMADADGRIKIGKGADIGGTSDPREYADHVHRGVEPPEFPTLDVGIFKPYATDVLTESKIPKQGSSYYANIVIPPNTNPHFSDDVTLEGVIYVQMPNKHPDMLIRGYLIALGDVKFEKHSSLHIGRPNGMSPALKFSLTYTPVPTTYLEVVH